MIKMDVRKNHAKRREFLKSFPYTHPKVSRG
jgi:hypothetical protein